LRKRSTDYIGLAEKAVTKAVEMRTVFIPIITGYHAQPKGSSSDGAVASVGSHQWALTHSKRIQKRQKEAAVAVAPGS
jgi:hypothetical protein